MRGLCAAVLVCLLLAPGSADEIVLTNGRRLSCDIIEVGDERVVVRLPHGTVEFPRHLVSEIRREDRGDYLKREAGSRLRRGSTGGAVELYERALQASPRDAEARAGLERALVSHARALAHQYRFRDAVKALERLEEVAPNRPEAAELAATL